jgi:hypothetical protein
MVKDRQPLLTGETGFKERAHNLRQVSRTEDRLWTRRQRPQVHHGLVDASFPASPHQLDQGGFAGRQVEMTMRAHPDEFTGSNDL